MPKLNKTQSKTSTSPIKFLEYLDTLASTVTEHLINQTALVLQKHRHGAYIRTGALATAPALIRFLRSMYLVSQGSSFEGGYITKEPQDLQNKLDRSLAHNDPKLFVREWSFIIHRIGELAERDTYPEDQDQHKFRFNFNKKPMLSPERPRSLKLVDDHIEYGIITSRRDIIPLIKEIDFHNLAIYKDTTKKSRPPAFRSDIPDKEVPVHRCIGYIPDNVLPSFALVPVSPSDNPYNVFLYTKHPK